MSRLLAAVALGLMLLPPMPARAQDAAEALDVIVVTGSRIGSQELGKTPAVSITRPGDYLVQNIELYNDSRDPEMRRKELHDTIANMLATSGSRYTLLHNGAYRSVLTRGNHSIEPDEDDSRDDSSVIALQVRTDLGGDPAKADAVIRAMREYIRDTRRAGRTVIELDGDSGLAMQRPERFRAELVQAIAHDAERMSAAMGMECQVAVEGLGQRIEWQRASAAELLLYIPYTMAFSDCRKPAAAQ
jgi:hypothetical protein